MKQPDVRNGPHLLRQKSDIHVDFTHRSSSLCGNQWVSK
jgi:hypothetical protein